jgi:hypothetical protein
LLLMLPLRTPINSLNFFINTTITPFISGIH